MLTRQTALQLVAYEEDRCLDIGAGEKPHNDTDHESWATRLRFSRLDGRNNGGIVRLGDRVKLLSEVPLCARSCCRRGACIATTQHCSATLPVCAGGAAVCAGGAAVCAGGAAVCAGGAAVRAQGGRKCCVHRMVESVWTSAGTVVPTQPTTTTAGLRCLTLCAVAINSRAVSPQVFHAVPLDGSTEVRYGQLCGLFSTANGARLDIGPANSDSHHNSWATQLQISTAASEEPILPVQQIKIVLSRSENYELLDVGRGPNPRKPSACDNGTTRVQFERVDALSRGPVCYGHEVRIRSTDGTLQLDVSVTVDDTAAVSEGGHDSWATAFVIRPLDGSSEVTYGQPLRIFTKDDQHCLDIGSSCTPVGHADSSGNCFRLETSAVSAPGWVQTWLQGPATVDQALNQTELAPQLRRPASPNPREQHASATRDAMATNLIKANERREQLSRVQQNAEQLEESSANFASTARKLRQTQEAQNEDCVIA